MKCPVCGAPYRQQLLCGRCSFDFSPVLRIYNEAVEKYNQGLEKARQTLWKPALKLLEEAIQLYCQEPKFFVLKGKLHAHLLQYEPARKCWQQALRMDEQNDSASLCLRHLNRLMPE